MASVTKTFSNASGNGSDFTICTLNGLPSIPVGAILSSLVLTFDAYRSGGGSNAEIFAKASGYEVRLYEDFPKKSTKSLSWNLTDYGLVNNNGGTLTYKDGSVVLNIRVYHDWNLFGQSDWTISNIKITANYTPHEHSYTTEVSRTASTCYTKGSVTTKCSCGETQSTELALDPNNHAGGTEIRNAKVATCTEAGYTGDTYCKGCGAKLSSGSTINALGHNYTSVVTPPTESSSGYMTHTCSRCGHSYVDSYIHRITVKSNNDNYGTVAGGGDYNDGKTATLTAVSKEGYKFVKWSDGVTSATRTIVATSSVTYTAYFELDRINLILIDTSQSLSVLIDTTEADKIYADTTKVYG